MTSRVPSNSDNLNLYYIILKNLKMRSKLRRTLSLNYNIPGLLIKQPLKRTSPLASLQRRLILTTMSLRIFRIGAKEIFHAFLEFSICNSTVQLMDRTTSPRLWRIFATGPAKGDGENEDDRGGGTTGSQYCKWGAEKALVHNGNWKALKERHTIFKSEERLPSGGWAWNYVLKQRDNIKQREF